VEGAFNKKTVGYRGVLHDIWTRVAVLIYKGWGMGTMPMCTLGFTCLALFYASILMLVVIARMGC